MKYKSLLLLCMMSQVYCSDNSSPKLNYSLTGLEESRNFWQKRTGCCCERCTDCAIACPNITMLVFLNVCWMIHRRIEALNDNERVD